MFGFAVLQRGMLVQAVPTMQDAGSELSAMLEMCVVSMFIIHIHWPVRSAQLQSVFVRLWLCFILFILFYYWLIVFVYKFWIHTKIAHVYCVWV